MGRFRDKYAPKMAATPDARAFDIVSAPLGTSGDEFGAIAHAAASIDTLEGFLRDMKARFPDASAISSATEQPPAAAPGAGAAAAPAPAKPTAPGPSASTDAPPVATEKPPATVPADPPPVPPARAAGHTAER